MNVTNITTVISSAQATYLMMTVKSHVGNLSSIGQLQMQLKIWEEKAQALAEERTKHRAALETELRALRAAQEEQAAKFDNSLTALQTASTAICAISQGGGEVGGGARGFFTGIMYGQA